MLRLAIIGCGEVVRELHVPALLKLRRARVLSVEALVDPSVKRAAAIGKDFPGATAYSSLEQALRDCRPDLTLVASPAGLHAEHGLAALAAGSHVLMEKPMTTTPAPARQLVDAADRAGLVLAVGLPRRLYAAFAGIAASVRRGDLGDHVRFTYREGDPYSWQVATGTPFQRAISGGGVLLDKGAHALDTLMQVFGPLRATAAWDDALVNGVESNVVVHLSGENAEGMLQLSWDQTLNNGFEIRGSRGAIAADLGDIHRYRFRDHSGHWRVVAPQVAWPDDTAATPTRRVVTRSYHDCFRLGWIAFIRAVLHREQPVATGRDGLSVIEMIHDAFERSEPLDMAWLDDSERASQAARHWRTPR